MLPPWRSKRNEPIIEFPSLQETSVDPGLNENVHTYRNPRALHPAEVEAGKYRTVRILNKSKEVSRVGREPR